MDELTLLERVINEITACARAEGLDFFPMRYEICPAEVIYTFGAYGMPTRFSHWSFGKAYYRIKTRYDYGLERIYEMVINTNPCYAFLLAGNSLVQNKLVVAHVLAHSDFFKNNVYFGHTSQGMIEVMAQSAARIREYELAYGRDRVERFLDAVVAIQEHIDPHSFIGRAGPARSERERERRKPNRTSGDGGEGVGGGCWRACFACTGPEKDLLRFIAQNAGALEAWERDIIEIVREETLYFWPQLTTKILNEGWATFWHLRLMRALELEEAEAIEFARIHAQLTQPGSFALNPYLVGLRLLEDIERRWGREKLFEVRATENDVSLVRNYLTEELVTELDLYVYRRAGQEWRVVSKDWKQVREALLSTLINGGYPYIVVADGNYKGRGELYLKHVYEGVELDLRHLERALGHVYHLWRRPVHLETVVDRRAVIFCCNGTRVSKEIK